MLQRLTAAALAVAATTGTVLAQDDDLRASVQNPISSLVSVPLKFTFDNGAPNGDANFFNLQPVVPVRVGGWNLVSRAIIPLTSAPGGISGLPDNPGVGDTFQTGTARGLGDINYTLFFNPAESTGAWTWGIGPSITAPTASDDRLGSGKWSAGLSAVALNQPSWGTYGGLVRHLWSFAGDSDRRGVSQTLVEPFLNYNLDSGWYLLTDSVITYDWKAQSGQELTLPIGGGFGKLFKIGDQAMNARTEAYYNVIRPDAGPKWTVGFTIQFLFPKG